MADDGSRARDLLQGHGLRAGAETPEVHRRAVLAISFSFLALFSGYNAAQGLQSSVNGVLGFVNLGTLYLTFTVVSVAAPALIQSLEARGVSLCRVMLFGSLVYVCMVAINATAMPAPGAPGRTAFVAANIFLSFLVGVAAPFLWTVQNIYVARCALRAACFSRGSESGMEVTRMTSAFNGLFYTFFQFAGALGTGVSSLVLLLDKGGNSRTSLFAVLGAFSLVGAFGFLVIPQMPTALETESTVSDQQDAPRFSQTLGLLASDSRMALIAPIIFSNGCFLGFQFGDYPKSFVTSTLGPELTGPALLTFYGCNAAASAAWGSLIRKGRLSVWTVMLVAFLLQLLVLVLLMVSSFGALPLFRQHYEFHQDGGSDLSKQWLLTDLGEPQLWEYIAPLLGAALAGIGDAAYESQIPAVCQAFFQDGRMVAAMANLKLWQSLGFAAQFLVGAAVSSSRVRVTGLAVLFVAAFLALAVLDRKVAPISGGRLAEGGPAAPAGGPGCGGAEVATASGAGGHRGRGGAEAAGAAAEGAARWSPAAAPAAVGGKEVH